MRVLVTGGRGFIGSHIVQALHAAGHEAVVFDVADSTDTDVRNREAVEAALPGVDAVCHQAAKVGLGVGTDDLPDYAAHNDVGTAVLLAAMARARLPHLVLAGSMVIYGEGAYTCPTHGSVPPGPRRVEDLENGRFEPPCPECGARLQPGLVTEEARPDPRNAYATSKLAQEHYAANWARATGGRVVALRYHNVYGPGLPLNTPYAGVAALFRSASRRGESPRVFEDGGQRRDFVHVRDIATANVAALEALTEQAGQAARVEPGTLRAYNVGSGRPRTVGELADALAKTLGGPDPVVTGGYRLGDVRHITASSERIRRELGWKPNVAFENGIAELAGEDA